MGVAYLAISYVCNQKCSFCPCSKEEKKYPYMSIETIKETINNMIDNVGISSIVLSGGEPTLHPYFIEILEFLNKKNLSITVLTNAEKFSNKEFVNEIEKSISIDRLTIVTTIHSEKKEEHERVNLSPGSFERSIQGLKNVSLIGIQAIIKHCITRVNYKDLKNFCVFVNEQFNETVSIQLCSIDYCGLSENEKTKHRVVFPELKKYFEQMFEYYIEQESQKKVRNLYCINMPLCSADPYYWRFFTGKPMRYNGYASPSVSGDSTLSFDVDQNVGTFCDDCKRCKVNEICPGTYKTAFEYFGNSIVKPFL